MTYGEILDLMNKTIDASKRAEKRAEKNRKKPKQKEVVEEVGGLIISERKI